MSLDDLDTADTNDGELIAQKQLAMERLFVLIRKLKPLDRQVIVLYLEGMDAGSIGEISGLSPGNVATKIHRIKSVLTQRFQEEVCNVVDELILDDMQNSRGRVMPSKKLRLRWTKFVGALRGFRT